MKFPGGVASIPTGDDDCDYPPDDTAKPARRIEFQEIEGVEESKPLVLRVSMAPIRICDARNPGLFIEVLSAAHESFDYVLCDWTLTRKELAAPYRLTRDSGITILCPQ